MGLTKTVTQAWQEEVPKGPRGLGSEQSGELRGRRGRPSRHTWSHERASPWSQSQGLEDQGQLPRTARCQRQTVPLECAEDCARQQMPRCLVQYGFSK